MVKIDDGIVKSPDPEDLEQKGFHVQPLESSHAKVVVSHWKFGTEQSESWVKTQIGIGLGFGVFPNSNGDRSSTASPVAWGLCYQ